MKGSDYRRCLDLLVTLIHDSWLHLSVSPSLISTLYKSLKHTLSLFSLLSSPVVPLVTAPNSGDSSTSALTSLSAGSQLYRLNFSFHRLPYNWHWHLQSQRQNQSYFTTGCLRTISSSCRQAPWDPRQEFLFSNWTLTIIVLMLHPL
jgi:hypothetical protein